MWSGIISPGSATMPSGNSGKSLVWRSGIDSSLGPGRNGLALVRRDQQVVEDPRRQQRLEHTLVDLLQEQIPVERVLSPRHRHVVGRRTRLERAIEPSEPIRNQLLAAHVDVAEAG